MSGTQARFDRWANVKPGPNSEAYRVDSNGVALDFQAGKDLRVLEDIRRDIEVRYHAHIDICAALEQQLKETKAKRAELEEQLGAIDRLCDLARDAK